MTFQKVAKIIAEYRDMPESDISLETTFEELGLDSLDTVELIMNFEDEFQISIEVDESLKNIADVVNLIDNFNK